MCIRDSCIAVLIETPRTVTVQICQQVVTGMLEFLAVESQPHQPDPEGEQFIVAVGLAHDRAALGDSLGGDSKAQIHIGGDFSRVERCV